MPIIKNNLYYELTSETKTKPVSAIKIQMDVLDRCEHSCSGCFVNRRNNAPSDSDLAGFMSRVKSMTEEGLLVDEILIGPTDFLSSSNFYDVLSNKDLLKTINDNSPILAFVTTLMGGDILKFCSFITKNINTDTEIEIGIATNPETLMDIGYIEDVKYKLSILSDNLEHDITYTFLLNIEDREIDYQRIHNHVTSMFDTTFDLIPSVARSGNKKKILDRIEQVNSFFNNLPPSSGTNNIMIDHSHSGNNFKVLNFKRGDWYISPFLYENMAIYDDMFKVNGIQDFHNKVVEQYSHETECTNCDFLTSCASRGIPMLMKFLETESCICPKENMIKNKYALSHAANSMYDWSDYSVESDKAGYRKKFLVHEDNIKDLDRLKEIYESRR